MKEDKVFVRTFFINLVLTLFLFFVLWLVVDIYFSISLLFGSVGSMLLMYVMYKQSHKLLKEEVKDASRKYLQGYILRYLAYALILITAVYVNQIDVLAVAIGLLLFKGSLYISFLIEKRGVTE